MKPVIAFLILGCLAFFNAKTVAKSVDIARKKAERKSDELESADFQDDELGEEVIEVIIEGRVGFFCPCPEDYVPLGERMARKYECYCPWPNCRPGFQLSK